MSQIIREASITIGVVGGSSETLNASRFTPALRIRQTLFFLMPILSVIIPKSSLFCKISLQLDLLKVSFKDLQVISLRNLAKIRLDEKINPKPPNACTWKGTLSIFAARAP